jgi:hypothetical protein
MKWDTQIPNWKLTLIESKRLDIQMGMVLSLAKTEQFAFMEINF